MVKCCEFGSDSFSYFGSGSVFSQNGKIRIRGERKDLDRRGKNGVTGQAWNLDLQLAILYSKLLYIKWVITSWTHITC